MMPIVLTILAALGGVAFWRRKNIQSDAKKVGKAARHTVDKVRSGRKQLYTELGEHVYAQSRGDNGIDHDADIDRIIGELSAIDAAEAQASAVETGGAATEEEPAAV